MKKKTKRAKPRKPLSHYAAEARYKKAHTKIKTKIHQTIKDILQSKGLIEFKSEFAVGRYNIDEAWPEKLIAIEINGCYWHSCPICKKVGPKKIPNKDIVKRSFLKRRGWIVYTLWEHDILKDPLACVEALLLC
jgi:DNA mismatch endonuclease (patch repair protein)